VRKNGVRHEEQEATWEELPRIGVERHGCCCSDAEVEAGLCRGLLVGALEVDG
jgi:hypothetical protein